jgi:hypothetical protein
MKGEVNRSVWGQKRKLCARVVSVSKEESQIFPKEIRILKC